MKESGQVVTVADPADVLDPGRGLESRREYGTNLAAVPSNRNSDRFRHLVSPDVVRGFVRHRRRCGLLGLVHRSRPRGAGLAAMPGRWP